MGLKPADVSPGDVLLFHGQGFVSWAIRAVDGTEVNHAAVALPGGMLGEAGGKGLQKRAIPRPGGGEFRFPGWRGAWCARPSTTRRRQSWTSCPSAQAG